MIELLGHVPKEGEQVVTEDGYRFTVERMELRSIDRLLLEFPK